MSEISAFPSGIFDGKRHYYGVRAYYEDTDLSGVVYHANYLRWFERARSDFLRVLGIDQRTAIETGEGAYAVVDMRIRYLSPAKLDDEVLIETACTAIGAASLQMKQWARRGDQTLTTADLRVGFVSPDGRAKRQPIPWRELYQSVCLEEE